MTAPLTPDKPNGDLEEKLRQLGLLEHQLRDATPLIQTAIDTAVEQAEQRGRAIGQYQAADKLYGDVCHIYMFGDNNSSAKARSISEWSAVGLLKDCEAFMNDNRKVYAEYLSQLTPPPVEHKAEN